MKACLSCYIFLLILVGQSLSGQQTNPFDVKGKKVVTDTTISIITDSSALPLKQATDNPFDIKGTAVGSDQAPAQDQKTQSTTSVDTPRQSTNTSTNPFDDKSKLSNTGVGDSNPFDIGTDPPSARVDDEDIAPTDAPKKKWFLQARTNHDTIYDEGFYLWPLLLSLLLLAGAVTLDRKALSGLYKAIANTNHLKVLQRSQQGGLSPFYILLYGLFIANLGLFLYFGIKHLSNISGGTSFLYVVAAVIGIYFIRHLVMWIVGAVFPFKEGVSRYNFTILTFNIMIGLMLLPINAVIAFTPYYKEAIYAGLSICVLMYVIRMFHGLLAVTGVKNINIYHFFIYLCATEIAPIVIVWKIISDSFSTL